MRWKIHLSYLGTHYCGWQKQPGDQTVQQTLEEAMSMILRQPVDVVGCGRTDTGVHARYYVAHVDVEDIELTDKLVYQINSVLPHDIAIHSINEADPTFHARFDAIRRQYKYYIHLEKDPFRMNQSFFFHFHAALDQTLMHKAADVLLRYQQFQPFCKTGSDADHFRCDLIESFWHFEPGRATYSITSNRFLRGMVRLIVGTCLNIGLGKISLDDLKKSMDQQIAVPHAWSVPPEGLFLENVLYRES